MPALLLPALIVLAAIAFAGTVFFEVVLLAGARVSAGMGRSMTAARP